MKAVFLPDDTAEWLLEKLMDDYPADEDLVDQYPVVYRHVATIIQAIGDAATLTGPALENR